ncbi:G-type lectin S-receptor-like serine/threonine-protein kinase RLK1 [Coffea arabica]|uniref:G-type lectin S-receptor-like serine/threonine-protein kinase RLK1 n=1 Tax=Coffea arabica TaxID=13443 RepID=A0ABM4VZV1_COFAR
MGSTLTAGETSASPWLSPSDEFAFGFQKVQDKDLFLFSIWYDKIPDKTAVRFVYSTNPVPRGSTVKLDPQTGLVLRDPRGLQLWSANPSQVDHGFMNDTGNFILKGSDDSWLWESFRFPADTILPYQDLVTGDSLCSRQSATNFSQGRFYLRFRDHGNLVLVTRSVPTNVDDEATYYNSLTSDSTDAFNSGYQVTFDGGGAIIAGEKGSEACGFNSVCHLEHGRPLRQLQAKTSLGCGEVEEGSAENLYDFEVVNDIDWPLSEFERINPSNETVCQQACLQDCFCAVAIFKDNSCWKKKLPLSNGRLDSRVLSKAFIKPRKSDGNAPPVYPNPPASIVPQEKEDHTLHIFPYKELVEATNEFKDELGRGSFGIVYRGELQISSKSSIVAVKKLDRVAKDAEKEFRAEVKAIGQTNHKNLVRLLGFCDEGQQSLLVYEYMSHGTLARLLLHDPKPSWNLRIQIAIGIARGLVYLHEECRTQVIHCDIKPQNILLDEHFNARTSDFGLAKLLMINQSRPMTSIRGTKGYVAPEWYRNTQITAKVDVYSFGVLLLEIISCRKCVEDIENIGEGENPILSDWAWDCFQEGRFDKFVENDSEALEDKMMLERFLMVALRCIQESSSLRPKMRKVSLMLEGIVEVMVLPCPYPFSTKS